MAEIPFIAPQNARRRGVLEATAGASTDHLLITVLAATGNASSLGIVSLLSSDVDRVCHRIRSQVNLDVQWPGGYPGQAELALVDAVLSIRARYGNSPATGVRKRVADYRDGAGDSTDDLAAMAHRRKLLLSLSQQQLPGGLLKGEALERAACRLVGAGFVSSGDFLAAEGALHRAKAAYVGVRGLGAVTFEYFLMLLGRPGIKADRHIVAFVSKALNGRRVDPSQAHALLSAAAHRLKMDPTTLDHAVWQHQRR